MFALSNQAASARDTSREHVTFSSKKYIHIISPATSICTFEYANYADARRRSASDDDVGDVDYMHDPPPPHHDAMRQTTLYEGGAEER